MFGHIEGVTSLVISKWFLLEDSSLTHSLIYLQTVMRYAGSPFSISLSLLFSRTETRFRSTMVPSHTGVHV